MQVTANKDAAIAYTSIEEQQDLSYQTTQSDIDKVISTEDKQRGLITVPLGFGRILPQIGTIDSVAEDEKDFKIGNLVTRFGYLKEPVKTGTKLSAEELEYAKEHTYIQLIFTKEYALEFAKILTAYATKETEDFKHFMENDS